MHYSKNRTVAYTLEIEFQICPYYLLLDAFLDF